MIKVALREEAAFPWVQTGKVYARGCCHTENGEAMNGADIASLFENCADKESFLEVLSRLNGLFSVIRIEDEHCMAAVDRVRMFPLYWIKTDNQLLITDDPIRLSEEYGCTAQNEQSVAEFLAAAHVCGNKTIFRDIFQIQSGHVIFYTNKRLTEHCYYRWAVSSLLDDDSMTLSLKGGSILYQAMERMRLSLSGRTAVIPLSGGYDSRAIACHLKQSGYKNVVCFTYGRRGNEEAAISQKVASRLGFPWIMVEYNREKIHNYLSDKTFAEYYPYASRATSMFFMQEYFAVKHLKENKLIPDDSVFIPGHSGDFLAGSQLNKYNISENESIESLSAKILKDKFSLVPPKDEFLSLIIRDINKFFEAALLENPEYIPWTIYEDRDLKEKLSKFICNSVNTYSFFGYEFRLPFYDLPLMDFFSRLPMLLKENKILYDNILINQYFNDLDVKFNFELQFRDSATTKTKIRRLAAPFAPSWLKKWKIRRNDSIFYHEITEEMLKDMRTHGLKPKLYGKTYNSLIVQWYIFNQSRALSSSKGTNLKLP